MLELILIGSAMIVDTVILESLVIAAAVSLLVHCMPRIHGWHRLARTSVALSALSLFLLAGISAALWMWAALFIWLGEFETMSDAIYFASVSATTVGYGDVVLSDEWKLLSGFIAANGLVLFSLNTAFLFEVLRRIGQDPAQQQNSVRHGQP
ncbi:MAG: potassium channel family protein [Pseudomonadota bacterium]